MAPNSKFNIIQANVMHAQELAKIGGDTFYETFRPHNTEEDIIAYIKKAYTIDVIKENLINPSIVYYLCYVDTDVIGYIKLIKDVQIDGINGKAIELEKIYVKSAFFGSGVGKILMQQAIDFSKQNEFDTLFLGVWQENERAVGFYKKMGFEVLATRQFKLGKRLCDDYMMKLDL